MLLKPFNLFNFQNKSTLSDTSIKEHQNFAENLLKEMKQSHQNDKSIKNSEILNLLKENKGEIIQSKVLEWLSQLSPENKIKICTIQCKWLIEILYQMYLLFQRDNRITFEPSDEMLFFFNEFNSLDSLNLLIYDKISSLDEIDSNNNEKEEEEINSNEKKNKEENDDIIFYKKYFVSSKKKENKNEEKIQYEKDFLQYIKIISLNDDQIDTITISVDLLSDMDKFKRCFKFFSNDYYFKDWLLPLKNKKGIYNFMLPSWMHKKNISFSFCQIIIGFLEQHILLNYEYFYYTNKIYDLSYHKNIINIYEENNILEVKLKNKSELIDKIFSSKIIEKIIEQIKKNKKYLDIYSKFRNICNKVYFDKYNFPLFDRNIFFENGLNSIISEEFKDYLKDIKNEKLRIKKAIDILTFLDFNKIINSRQLIYASFRANLLKYFCDKTNDKLNNEKIKNEDDIKESNEEKINKINEIHNLYTKDEQDSNSSNDKLKRIISKTSLGTKYQTEQFSLCDDSFSINSDTSLNIVANNNSDSSKINNVNKTFIQPNYNINTYYINNMNNLNNLFSMYYYSYYDKGINHYCSITNNNLVILNNLKVLKINIIKRIINDNLKDKFDITFGDYGSFFTGLSIEGSDMDICINYKNKGNLDLNFYNELYDLLLKQKPLLFNINKVPTKGIPLIKIEIDITEEIKKTPLNNYYRYLDYDDLTKIKIDITITDNEEYLKDLQKNVDYVQNSIKNYPQIKPVILFLKRYFKKKNMNKVYYEGISSFSLFLITLNAIKSYEKDMKNKQIGVSQLLFLILNKFSFFDFYHKGLGIDNYDYILKDENLDETLYILNPLTGKNVANGRCKGEKLRQTFFNILSLLNNEINNFRTYFYNGFYPFNIPAINSINALFNS